MDSRDNLYSQFVSLVKVLLPLAALGLLSTLFLLARDDGAPTAIPFSEIEQIASEQRISSPQFSGATASGATVSLTADRILPEPDQSGAFAISTIRAEVTATDGSSVRIIAREGDIDPRSGIAQLNGLTRLTASSGYVMETNGVTANISTGEIATNGRLEVQTPFGALTAGALRVVISDDGAAQRMVFNEGVRLLYQPQQDGATDQ